MKRVAVIGCPGAGKSTVAIELASISQLPLFCLDEMYHDASKWSADRTEKRQQWVTYLRTLVEKNEWIIDGNYRSTLALRVSAADTILYLDYPRWLCLGRAMERALRWYVGKKQPAGGNPGGMNAEFLKFIWTYRARERAQTLELLTTHQDGKQIFIFTNPKQTEAFLQNIGRIVQAQRNATSD